MPVHAQSQRVRFVFRARFAFDQLTNLSVTLAIGFTWKGLLIELHRFIQNFQALLQVSLRKLFTVNFRKFFGSTATV